MTKQTITRLIGAGLGLTAGILLLTIGFWKTLLLVTLAAVGWFFASDERLLSKAQALIARLRAPKEQ